MTKPCFVPATPYSIVQNGEDTQPYRRSLREWQKLSILAQTPPLSVLIPSGQPTCVNWETPDGHRTSVAARCDKTRFSTLPSHRVLKIFWGKKNYDKEPNCQGNQPCRPYNLENPLCAHENIKKVVYTWCSRVFE
jgi:hypothetical protein